MAQGFSARTPAAASEQARTQPFLVRSLMSAMRAIAAIHSEFGNGGVASLGGELAWVVMITASAFCWLDPLSISIIGDQGAHQDGAVMPVTVLTLRAGRRNEWQWLSRRTHVLLE